MANSQVIAIIAVSISVVSIGLLVAVQLSLQSDLRALNNNLIEQSEQIKSLDSELETTHQVIDQQKTAIDQMQSDFNATKAQLLKQNDEMSSLSQRAESMQADITLMQEKIKSLEDRLVSLEQKLKSQLSVASDRCPPPLPRQTLVGYWKFDEGNGTTACDSSDSRNTGILVNDPTRMPDSSCKIGKCLGFDGVNDYVEIGTPSNLNTLTSITLDAWVNRLGPGVGNFPEFNVIVGKAGLAGRADSDPWHLRWTDGMAQFTIVTTDGTITDMAGPILPDGVWHHVAGTFDGSTRAMKLYVNGLVVAEKTAPAGLAVNTVIPVRIGISSNNSALEPFNGLIDEVEIYNRALSASEIQAIFNTGSAAKQK